MSVDASKIIDLSCGSIPCLAHGVQDVKLMAPSLIPDDFNPIQEYRLQIQGQVKLIHRINLPSLFQNFNPRRARGGLLITLLSHLMLHYMANFKIPLIFTISTVYAL